VLEVEWPSFSRTHTPSVEHAFLWLWFNDCSPRKTFEYLQLYCKKLELTYIFAADWYGSIFVQMFAVDSEKRIPSAIECISTIHGHPSRWFCMV